MKIYAKRPVHLVPGITAQVDWKGGFFSFGRVEHGPRPRRFFNASILRHQDADWLFVRMAEDVPEHRFGQNSIWVFKLNDQHIPIFGKKVNFPTQYNAQHFEDPRVTKLTDGRIIISYTTFVIEVAHDEPGTTSWYGAHQAIAFLDDDLNVMYVIDPLYGGNGGSVLQNATDDNGHKINQKNWNWFQHEDLIHLVYMTEPHEVVRWGADWNPEEAFRMQTVIPAWAPYGHPRGGTPPVKIGDEYWSFFHSSTPWKEWNRDHPGDVKRRYHMGAYAFEAKPPFHITRFSEVPFLTGSMRDPWYPGLPLVVFPCGALFRDGEWLVTIGINDCACAWMEIPHKDLIKLTPPYANQEAAKNSAETVTELEEDNRDSANHCSVEDGQRECGQSGPTPVESPNAGNVGDSGGHGTYHKVRRRMRRRKVGQDQWVRGSPVESPASGGTVAGNA